MPRGSVWCSDAVASMVLGAVRRTGRRDGCQAHRLAPRAWRATTRSSTSRSSARRISIACSSRRRASSRSSAATRCRATVHSTAARVDDTHRVVVEAAGDGDRAGGVLEAELRAVEVFVGLRAVGPRGGRVFLDPGVQRVGRLTGGVVRVHQRGARDVLLQPAYPEYLFEPEAKAFQPPPPPTRRLSAAHASDAEPSS